MAKPNEIRHPQAACLFEEYVIRRGQSLGYSADLNSEDVRQLTSDNVVEVVDGAPTVNLTLDTNEHGSINLAAVIAGYTYTGLPDNTVVATAGAVTNAVLYNNPVDIIVAIDENSDSTQDRALWFNSCYLDSLSGTFQVDGFATESVSMSGIGQSWFLNAAGTARVKAGVYGAANRITCAGTFTDVSTVLAVTENGIRLVAGTDYTHNVSAGSTMNLADATIYAVGTKAFDANKRYRIVYTTRTKAQPALSTEVSSPMGGIKENEVQIYLSNTSDGSITNNSDSSRLLRCQSVDYEVSFDREDLKQLYTGTYAKGLNSTNITANITVLDSDLELYARGAGDKEIATTANTELKLSDFQGMTTLALTINIYRTKDTSLHTAANLLKCIYLSGGKVTSVSESRDVPGRGTQTMAIKFTTFTVTGTGKAGRA